MKTVPFQKEADQAYADGYRDGFDKCEATRKQLEIRVDYLESRVSSLLQHVCFR